MKDWITWLKNREELTAPQTNLESVATSYNRMAQLWWLTAYAHYDTGIPQSTTKSRTSGITADNFSSSSLDSSQAPIFSHGDTHANKTLINKKIKKNIFK